MKIPKVSYQSLSWLRILIVVGVLGHAVFSVHQFEKQTVEVAGESLTRIAADIADKLDLLLFERYGDMQTMSKSGILPGQDPSAMSNYLDLFQKAYPIYRWLAVTDAQGRIIAATDRSSVGQDRSRESWFQRVRETGHIHIQDAEPSLEAGGELAVAFSAPLHGPDADFTGAVTARIGLPALRKIFDRTVIPLQMSGDPSAIVEWQLLAGDGELIADSRLGEEGKVNLRNLGVPSVLMSQNAEPGYLEEHHRRRSVDIVRGFARTKGVGEFPGLGWTVLVNMDRADIVAPLHRIIVNLGLTGSLIFVPLVGLLFWLTKRLRQEWEQVQTEAARAVKAEQKYRAARDQLADVLDYAPDPIFFTDTEGKVTRVSRGAQRVLGYAAEALIAKNVEELFLNPCQWESILHELKVKGEVIGREVEFRNPDGRPVNISLTLSLLRDQEGRSAGTVGLCKDVTVAKRTEEALRISNEELENFVYAISHDLQAPLRGIQGFAVLLMNRAGERLEQQERHYLERIRKGAERMEELIRDLLEYSRIERITHPWELVSMEQILLQVRMDMEDRIRQTHTTLQIEEALPWVYGDRVRLVQLWSNLLSNAIKYARPSEPAVISVGCRKDDQYFIFWIRDLGIGISPEFHQKIFGVFNRLHQQEEVEGTGIGLAIVKRIVEFHKGKIWVESAEGEGSTFLFTLPKTHGGYGKTMSTGLATLPPAGLGTASEKQGPAAPSIKPG
jgi:PAS domain S-box-containing protein